MKAWCFIKCLWKVTRITFSLKHRHNDLFKKHMINILINMNIRFKLKQNQDSPRCNEKTERKLKEPLHQAINCSAISSAVEQGSSDAKTILYYWRALALYVVVALLTHKLARMALPIRRSQITVVHVRGSQNIFAHNWFRSYGNPVQCAYSTHFEHRNPIRHTHPLAVTHSHVGGNGSPLAICLRCVCVCV